MVAPRFRGEKYCETSHSNHNGIEETVIGLPAVSRLHINCIKEAQFRPLKVLSLG